MKERLPKRFYKTVSIAQSGNAHAILLDGKPAKAGSTPLRLPTRALAEAVVQEWREQETQLDPDRMRLTGLAGRALNRVAPNRGDVVEHIMAFGRNELLCYRAAEPADLVTPQKAAWDPLLKWIHACHGVRLVSDSGIGFIKQPADALLRMQEVVSAFDDFELVAFEAAVSLASSFVVALALIKRHIGAYEAFAVSHLDELYQAEKWSRDAEAEQRRVRIVEEMKAVEHFVSLLKDSR